MAKIIRNVSQNGQEFSIPAVRVQVRRTPAPGGSPMRWKAGGILFAAFCAFAVQAMAQTNVPPEGITAEGEKRWDDAIGIYKAAISNDAQRSDLWLRIADIQSFVGRPGEAAVAIQQAADLKPKDAALQFSAAKAFSMANKPGQALEAVNRALALEPNNLDYLRACAQYADWMGQVDLSATTYRRILGVVTNDEAALAGLAGAVSWRGKPEDRVVMAEQLQKAADMKPKDAALQFRVAQAYSMANKPEAALEAVNRALALDPNNREYLLARAEYADWLGKLDVAADSYRRVVVLAPNDDNSMLLLARAEARGGRLDASVRAFRKYLKQHPENKEAWMDYVKAETWRGNFAVAMKSLEEYGQKFGETTDYRQQKARILAGANRPTAAMDVVLPLLKDAPNDYEAQFSKTQALYDGRRLREAVTNLAFLASLRPESTDTEEIRRMVMADIRHQATAGGEYYRESDSVRIIRFYGEGRCQIDPDTRVVASGTDRELDARIGSGLEDADGRSKTRAWNVEGGIDYRLSPALSIAVRAGGAEAAATNKMFVYALTANYQPLDNLVFTLENNRSYYTVSPRAVSLGIERETSALNATWCPDLNYTVNSYLAYDSFSDDNSQWQAVLAARRSVIRSAMLNLDLGPYLSWAGFANDPNDGYYSPSRFERYALKADGYCKLGKDSGVAFVFTAGEQKDNNSSGFQFGTSGDVEGQFGVYGDWMLKLHAGYTQNATGPIGNFNSQVYGASLTRRF